MQDRVRCFMPVRALVNLSGGLAGLMMILVGSLIPAGLLIPGANYPVEIIDLPVTWQVPSLLLCALLCGPRAGVIASTAYLTIGLFYLPIFHDGGYMGYLNNPGFAYLLGFIPAAWLSGKLAKQKGMNNLVLLTASAFAGLVLLHICGFINLIIGHLINIWNEPFSVMFYSYSLAPFPAQTLMCIPTALVALLLRNILLIE